MKPGGSKPKVKGSSYERHVRDILTAVYYPDGDGEFQRIDSKLNPQKGIVRSDLIALRYIIIGDPLTKDPEKALVADRSFPFSIECKNYTKVKPLFCGLYSKDCEVWDWMDQAHLASEGRMPLVVFRLYRTSDVAMLESTDFSKLEELFGRYPHSVYKITKQADETRVQASMETIIIPSICLLLLTDLLEWIDWGVFRLSASSKYIRSLVPKEEQHG